MKRPQITVVVPTIRENSIQRFLKEWSPLFSRMSTRVLIVEDNPSSTFKLPNLEYNYSLNHYSCSDTQNDLGRDSWIIPRRTGAIKSYGFWKAYQGGADIIITLDDDCYPLSSYLPSFIQKNAITSHMENLTKPTQEPAWASSINAIRPRGLPYRHTTRTIHSDSIVMSHGLWAHIPDLDGETQLSIKKLPTIKEYFLHQIIPIGSYTPLSGMNLAWKREMTPSMYFLLMGENASGKKWGYDRFDDIWAGIFTKKICDHIGLRIISGYPVIWHDRQSNALINKKKEARGKKLNESLWKMVDQIRLTKSDIPSLYKELAAKLPLRTEYGKHLIRAMQVWASLF